MTRRRILGVAVLTVFSIAGLFLLQVWQAAEQFQQDADIVRLQHLRHYAELIDEYRVATGQLPFADEAPVQVFVANESQQRYTRPPYFVPGPPPRPTMKTVTEFIAELELGLGRPVKERYDPQYAPRGRPNFYEYYVSPGGVYYFRVHLHRSQPFAVRVKDQHYRAQLTNGSRKPFGPRIDQTVLASKAFRDAESAPISKPGFFADREKRDEGWTKRAAVRRRPIAAE